MAAKAKTTKPTNPVGRKTKRTPETEAKLFEALRWGCTRRAACAHAKITESTLYDWMSDFSEFSEGVVEAENEAEVGFTKILQQAARNGDWKAAESWLKRRRRDDWSERMEQTGANGGAVKHLVSAKELSDDELAAIIGS